MHYARYGRLESVILGTMNKHQVIKLMIMHSIPNHEKKLSSLWILKGIFI